MGKIVVLDGYALNPGDLDWGGIRQLGDLTVYDRTVPSELLTRAQGAEIILTNKTVLDATTLGRLESLKYISVLATGWNVIDIAAANAAQIVVSNVPAYSTESVAQMAVAHLVNLAGRFVEHTTEVGKGKWGESVDFCFYRPPLVELAGKTLGIVGLGTIGRRVAQIAQAFGMKVVAYGPRLAVGNLTDGILAVTLDELFVVSDVVSLHCPLTPLNRNLVNAERLATMKRSAFLINTARGPLIDEQALADALNEGRLAGAGLDVLDREPAVITNRLVTAKNCFITPHIAWATIEARQRLMAVTEANIRAYLDGKPQNVVS